MTTNFVGRKAIFKDYAQLEEGFQPIFKAGQLVYLSKEDQHGGYVALAIDEAGQYLDTNGEVLAEGGQAMGDSVWLTELDILEETPVSTETVAATETPATEADPVALDLSKAKTAELDEWASRNGVALPDGWAKMKVADKRTFLTSWVSGATADGETSSEAEAADAVQAEPEVATQTGIVPVPEAMIRHFDDAASVKEILVEKDIMAAAKFLVTQEHRTHHTLGGVLLKIDETGIHKRYGYDGKKGFENFCKAELDIEYRKARYLMNSYRTFQSIGVDELRLEQIGWSKAKELARINAEFLSADIDTLLGYAEEHTREQLTEYIKTNYEIATRGQQVQTTTFSFKVVEAEAEPIKAALDHAKTLTNSDDPNKAFAYIVNDWQTGSEGADLDLETFIRLGIERFGKDELLAAVSAAEEGPSLEAQTEAA